MTLLFEQLP